MPTTELIAMDYFIGPKGVRINYWAKMNEKEYVVTLLTNNQTLSKVKPDSRFGVLESEISIYNLLAREGLRKTWKPTKKGGFTCFVYSPNYGTARLFIWEN